MEWVTATPEPQLAFLMNLVLPGTGTKITAYYKVGGGFCHKTFAMGEFQEVTHFLLHLVGWFLLDPITRSVYELLVLGAYGWVIYHSYITWKISREMYNKN